MEWNLCKAYFLEKNTNSEVKIGSLNVNNMKNVEARYEVLQKMHVMEIFLIGEETCNVKEYLLALRADEKKCF